MLPAVIIGPLLSMLNGPVFSIVDKLIPDPNLKAKLKAEITTKVLEARKEFESAQRDVLLAEVSQGSVMTRSWRPVLMYLVMLFLLVYGLILPIIDLFVSNPITFKPRWNEIPDGMWNLLSIGVGGYIGGRTIEKVTSTVSKYLPTRKLRQHTGINRKNNLSN